MNKCKACQNLLAYGTERCPFCSICQLPDKWVEVSQGHHKFVPGDDPRPAVPTPHRTLEDLRNVNVISKPSWVDTAERLMPDPSKLDSQGERDATDAMLVEREKETKHSSKARNWEEGRKREWAANKKYWIKDQEYKKQKDTEKTIKEVSDKYGL